MHTTISTGIVGTRCHGRMPPAISLDFPAMLSLETIKIQNTKNSFQDCCTHFLLRTFLKMAVYLNYILNVKFCCQYPLLNYLIQVLWGGRWQDGSASTTGEEVEQINAHVSRCTNTTKYMLPEGTII